MFKIELTYINGEKEEWRLDNVSKKEKRSLNNMIRLSNVIVFRGKSSDTQIYIPKSSILSIKTTEIGEE